MSVYDKIREELKKEKLYSQYFDYASAMEVVNRVENRENQVKSEDKVTEPSDSDKLLKLLERYKGSQVSFEEIMIHFMSLHYSEFPASRVNHIMTSLNTAFLMPKIGTMETAIAVANERASYLKKYLEGSMYTTEESARIHAPVQAKNAEAIIEACANVNREV